MQDNVEFLMFGLPFPFFSVWWYNNRQDNLSTWSRLWLYGRATVSLNTTGTIMLLYVLSDNSVGVVVKEAEICPLPSVWNKRNLSITNKCQ